MTSWKVRTNLFGQCAMLPYNHLSGCQVLWRSRQPISSAVHTLKDALNILLH
jgi:hypothetical protein